MNSAMMFVFISGTSEIFKFYLSFNQYDFVAFMLITKNEVVLKIVIAYVKHAFIALFLPFLSSF